MAYAIEQRPAEITPAFNPCVFVVSSSNFAEPNHSFICDIKIGALLIARERFRPAPTFANAFLDIGRIVSNFVNFDLNTALALPSRMANSQASFTIEFGEIYDIAGVPTQTLNLQSDTFTATNIGLTTYDFLNYNPSSYVQQIINRETTKLRINSLAWLSFYHNNTDQVTSIRVTATNAAAVDTVSVLVQPLTASNPLDRFIYFPSGSNLNTVLQANLASGTEGNVIPSNTVRYKIELLNAATVVDSHTYTIINTCYADYEVYYLNENGAFSTLVFNKNYKISHSVNRTTAERLKSAMITTTTYGYNSQSAQRVTQTIINSQMWMLNTDWISEAESATLFQLIGSPVLFLNDNGTIKRVNIAGSATYNEENIRANKMFNFTINLEDSQTQERQWLN